MTEIPITEEFNDPQGRWDNYDAYDPTVRAAIQAQSHVTIRSFVQNDITSRETVFGLNGLPMSSLDGLTMTALEGTTPVIKGEGWTAGTVGPESSLSGWNTLQLTLTIGANSTSSIVYTPTGQVAPIDLQTGFADTDYISAALPNLPLTSIDPTQSFIDFTSEPTGNFTTGPTDSLPLSSSSVPLVNGNSEFRVQRSALATVNKQAITAVRFRVQATAAATFTVAALRLLGAAWNYLPVEQDTRYGFLRRTVALNGDPNRVYDYTWPILWKADVPSGNADPRPINGEIGVTFNTGSMTQTNNFTLYFREREEAFMTMLDLDGTTMGQLDGQPQPDLGTQTYNPRTQQELEAFPQSALETKTQQELERGSSGLNASWNQFIFQWMPTGGTISMQDTDGNGYTFPVGTLTANKSYILLVDLNDNGAHIAIYPLDNAGNIDQSNLVYDTNWQIDDFVFKRRKGRFGWSAALADGDAYVDAIRSRGLEFAEQRVNAYPSFTPVIGCELFAEYTPDRQLFQGVDAYGQFTIIDLDSSRTTSAESYRIQVSQGASNQGLVTSLMPLTNFGETEIEFDLFVPSTAIDLGINLQPFLTNDNQRYIPLALGTIYPDQWTHYRIPLYLTLAQTGTYRFGLVNTTNTSLTFWMDRIQVYERSVKWSGRAITDDPWQSNQALWVDFKSNINKENSGIMFYERGTNLQIRAKALRQDAYLGKKQWRPRYAQLGRVTFDQRPTTSPPVASFTSAPVGGVAHSQTFNGLGSTSNSRIVMYEWDFGDGTNDFGPNVTHVYPQAGSYSATLVVTDVYGNRAQATTLITV